MSTRVRNTEVCTISDARSEKWLLRFFVAATTALFTVGVGGQVNTTLAEYLVTAFPQFSGDFYDNAWIAVTEEFTVRLLPMLVAYAGYRLTTRSSRRCLNVASVALGLGLLTGLTMGVLEIYAKVFTTTVGPFQTEFQPPFTPFFWEHPDFTVVMLPPVLMHSFNGVLIGGTFFRAVSDGVQRRDVLAVLAAFAVAVGIHFVWNTWWVTQDWFWTWWESLFMVIV